MVPDVDLFNQKVEGTAWRSKPSWYWYIVAKNDRTVHPELERFAAKRMGAITYEVESSHVPMLSQPNIVLDVIRTAATSVLEAAAAYDRALQKPRDPLRSHTFESRPRSSSPRSELHSKRWCRN